MTRRAAAFLLSLVFAACTAADPGPSATSTTPSPPGEASAEPLVLPVVATLTGERAAEDATFLDGIRLGTRAVNRLGGFRGRRLEVAIHDDEGKERTATRLLLDAVGDGVPVVVVVGPEGSVIRARPEIQAAGTPVILLGGDLYSEREMFRQTFQTSIPLRWQATVVARYLVQDREYDRVSLVEEIARDVGIGEEERSPASEALGLAMVEEGRSLGQEAGLRPGASAKKVAEDLDYLRTFDAAAYFGEPGLGGRVAGAIRRMDDPPQLATSSHGLLEAVASGGRLPPGTVAPYPYTWAGWAEPLRRVATFRDLSRRVLGHPPRGFEQEGYDAVRLLADALRASDGHGGDPLIRALEAFDEELYSSLPIGLGPDDHLFYSDRQLGLFAVAGPGEDAEPWAPGWAPWRPLMRTFTVNGERTTIIDRDKDVFFPGWRPKEPAPDFWTSRYGIVTRRGDPLH